MRWSCIPPPGYLGRLRLRHSPQRLLSHHTSQGQLFVWTPTVLAGTPLHHYKARTATLLLCELPCRLPWTRCVERGASGVKTNTGLNARYHYNARNMHTAESLRISATWQCFEILLPVTGNSFIQQFFLPQKAPRAL